MLASPGTEAAWTGNLVVGEGTIPPLFEGGEEVYLKTIARFAAALDVETIVPGHGIMTSGAILTRYLNYLSELIRAVRKASAKGQTLEEILAHNPLWERYAPAEDSPSARLEPFLAGLHRLNLQNTYKDLNGR